MAWCALKVHTIIQECPRQKLGDSTSNPNLTPYMQYSCIRVSV